MPASLPKEILLQLEYEFCRAGKRPTWWRESRNLGSTEALGCFMGRLLERRNELVGGSAGAGSELKQRALVARFQEQRHPITKNNLNNFLNGKRDGKTTWTKYAPMLLDHVLAWSNGNPGAEQEERRIASRISAFIFDFSPGQFQDERESTKESNKLWFFDPSLRDVAYPATSREGIAELRALIHRVLYRNASDARIFRVSGGRRFRLMDNGGGLSEVGEVAIEAMQAGIHQFFVYPPPGPARDGAMESAKEFLNAACEQGADACQRIRLIEIDPASSSKTETNMSLWGGELLSGLTSIVCYSWTGPDGQIKNTLMIGRYRHGPSLFEPTPEEVEVVWQWLTAFVLRGTKPQSSRGVAKRKTS
ncbi:MAG: hypothetical protein HOP29_04310 [Phycisphaerales bacterium]|nr:hypothetical protein [Phycisphaerales bacterium]